MAEQVNVIIEAILKSDQFQSGVKSAVKSVDAANNKLKEQDGLLSKIKLGWLAAAAGIATAMAGIKKAFDLAKEFADFEEQAQQMQLQFGVNANEVITAMQKASDGTLSMKDAVSTATKAMATGVSTDIGTIANLYDIAAKKGDAMGIGNAEAFDMLVGALAKGQRGAKQLEQQLGFNTSAWADQMKGMDGAAQKQFMLDQVQKQGLLTQQKLEAAAETSADKFDRFSATISDLKIVIGKGILEEFGKLSESISLPVSVGQGYKLVSGGIKLIGLFTALVVDQWIWFGEFLKTIWNVPLQSLKMFGKVAYDIATGDFKAAMNAPVDAFKNMGAQASSSFEVIKKGLSGIEKQWDGLFENKNIISDPTAGTAGGVTGGGDSNSDPAASPVVEEQKAISSIMLDEYNKRKAMDEAAIDNEIRMREEATGIIGEFTKQAEEDVLAGKIKALQEFEQIYADDQDLLLRLTTARVEAENQLQERQKQETLKNMEDTVQAIGEYGDQFLGIFENVSASRINGLETEKNAEIEKLNSDLENFVGTEEEKKAFEEKTAEERKAIEDSFSKKILAEKTKQAKAQKAAAIFSATVNGALAIIRQYADLPLVAAIPASILTGAATAAQIAAIASSPLPTFAHGGRPDAGKPSIVGERGAEVFIPDSAGRIIPHHMLKDLSIPSGRSGGGFSDNSSSTISNDNSKTEIKFYGIQDLGAARNALARKEGKKAFIL